MAHTQIAISIIELGEAADAPPKKQYSNNIVVISLWHVIKAYTKRKQNEHPTHMIFVN